MSEKISIWKILYMGSYMESINSKPDLIHVFKLEKFENLWNFFSQYRNFAIATGVAKFKITISPKIKLMIEKFRARFVDAKVWIVFRRDRSPNFFVAGLNQSDPRHEHALTNHITGFDLVSICTYWITFPFRYLLFGHYHMTHIISIVTRWRNRMLRNSIT